MSLNQIMCYGGLILSVVCLVGAAVMFFTRDIPGVVRYFMKMKSYTPAFQVLDGKKRRKPPRLTHSEKPQSKRLQGAPAPVKLMPPARKGNAAIVRDRQPQQSRGPSPSQDEYIDYLVARKFEKLSHDEKKQLRNAYKFATALLEADFTQALPNIDNN